MASPLVCATYDPMASCRILGRRRTVVQRRSFTCTTRIETSKISPAFRAGHEQGVVACAAGGPGSGRPELYECSGLKNPRAFQTRYEASSTHGSNLGRSEAVWPSCDYGQSP
jgi:hypothetical protein